MALIQFLMASYKAQAAAAQGRLAEPPQLAGQDRRHCRGAALA
jgi:hypothetical protein